MTLFDWLKELTGKKRDWDSFSEKERESFNPYMVNRFVSMHQPFVELVNYVQNIPYTDKKKYYTIFTQLLPKKNVWLKYIKSKTKTPKTELTEAFVKIYKCSTREVVDYLLILDKSEIKSTLQKSGYQPKEITKMLK
jgi:hypothetical protein|tara:strand:+ start:713 stop:1123 length:411 start_codon:yes stop_codon:yes gene_type:complete